MFLSTTDATPSSVDSELFYWAIKNRPLKPVSIFLQLYILVQLRTRPVVVWIALTLVEAAKVDKRDLICTYAACSRCEAGNVYVIADTEAHFRPLKTYVRANCIEVAIPATEIEYGVFLILLVVAGVKNEPYRSAQHHLLCACLCLVKGAGIKHSIVIHIK